MMVTKGKDLRIFLDDVEITADLVNEPDIDVTVVHVPRWPTTLFPQITTDEIKQAVDRYHLTYSQTVVWDHVDAFALRSAFDNLGIDLGFNDDPRFVQAALLLAFVVITALVYLTAVS